MADPPSLRVLVIDPDLSACADLCDLLEAGGYRVTHCCEPQEALPEIAGRRQQIVLLDVRGADSDGIGVLSRIRALDSDLCVIAITDRPAVETAVEVLRLGAFDYLRKPVDPAELREVLARAAREKGLWVDGDGQLNAQLGSRLRSLRKRRELTLRQVANKASLSVSLISQIELGKSAASIATLRRLSAALGEPLSDLFRGL